MKINDGHSINRVKQTLAKAEGKTSRRAARVRIACRKWLGTWGPSGVKGQSYPT